MDYTPSNRGDNTFASSNAPNAGSPSTSTSLAAAAADSSTLAVKLSDDPEDHSLSGNQDIGDDKQSVLEDSRTFLKEGEDDPRSRSPAIRRSRSGRLLRSTVQYDERSRSSSPDNLAEQQGTHARKTRSSFHNKMGASDSDRPYDASEQDSFNGQGRDPSESGTQNDKKRQEGDGGSPSQQDVEMQEAGQYDDNRDELASDEEQDDGLTEEGEDGNNDGSGSAETSSTKNDDGSDPLVVSMYGSPSLVKVRSMFIDKLYKMVQDNNIQHLISWAKEGDMFYVYNCIELSNAVLPKFFKHNNWQSFVRQLNMYGFHKIYRYDREESTMNRKNPETQRWQFYHPDFQRDRPQLRNNIKRKSARSVNVAPTFPRVVFERDKGYYVQQEHPSRVFNGQAVHNRPHGPGHSPEMSRHGHIHGGPPPGAHHYPHSAAPHRSPHDSAQRPSYRPPPGHHPSEPMHPRDEKDMMPSRREHEPQHHQYPGSYHQQGQQQQQQPYGNPHQRQHSYAGPPQAHYSPEQGYNHKPHGFNSPHPPPQDLHHGGPPGHAIAGRSANSSHGPGSSGEAGYSEHGGHFRSQSAPGVDPRRPESTRGPHPFSQQDPQRSPPTPNSQSYYQREPYPPHRHQGPFDDNGSKAHPSSDPGVGGNEGPSPTHRGSLSKHPLSPMDNRHPHANTAGHPPSSHVQHSYSEPNRRNNSLSMGGEPDDHGRRFSSPSQSRQPLLPLSPSSQQPMSEPILPVDSVPTTPGQDPNAIPHDRTVKQLESRLQFVEDAYMSLRSFVQDLQNTQHSQDQTMNWMRERIEQLTEANTPRDVMTSPPLAGAVPSKRKAEYSPGDSREWRRPHPDHPSSMYSRHGPVPPGPASIAQASSQGPSPGGQSPRVRYEPPNFHSSFNPVHHPPPPTPRTPPMQQQQLSQQQQAPQAQSGPQRQHPSPPMGSSHPHYQKASVTSMLHD